MKFVKMHVINELGFFLIGNYGVLNGSFWLGGFFIYCGSRAVHYASNFWFWKGFSLFCVLSTLSFICIILFLLILFS